ncbi:MAG: TonB-dependent receptor [Candidatus Nitronauta litoralis]|uniref:TonB-dependent receptor n=1 Tax=Candidatus Nitronauta litoralis TaxID=2705533 RepID=A0A7T0BU37_9BACT|nr:MAG: TonB-dependent receptor [Candidatus Nitronauta litoralis]
MKTRHIVCGVICTLVAVLCASAGFAADKAAKVQSIQLKEVFVTANREEQLEKDISQSVGSVGTEAIDVTTTNGLHEIMNRIPGVVVKNRFGSDDVVISVRGSGIRSNFGVRGAFIMIDGIPLTEPDGQTRLDVIDLAAVERVEVVRGPASIIYGGNTSGGVINLITKKGEEGFHSDNRIMGGSFGFFKAYTSAYGTEGNFRYHLGASHTQKDGYRAHSKTEGQRFNGNLEWELDDKSSLQMMLAAAAVDIKIPGGITRAQMLANPRSALANNVTNDFARYDDRFRYGVKYRRELTDHLTGSVTGYWDWRRLDHPIFQFIEIDRIATGGDFRLSYDRPLFGHDNNMVFGYNIQYQSSDTQRYQNAGGNRGALTVDEDTVIDNSGVYFQDQFSILPNLKLTGGARWSLVEFDLTDDFPADGNQTGFRDVEEVTYHVGLNYQPTEEITLFANHSTAFETPTESEFTSGLTGGFINLMPMLVDNYEVGVRAGFDVLGMPGQVQVSWFHMEFENFLLPRTVGFRTTFSNAGTAENEGVEVGLAIDPLPDLHFETTYAYSDFDFTAGAFTGNQMPGQAPHIVFGLLEYDLFLPWDIMLKPGAEVRWSDGYFLDDINTVTNSSFTTLALRLNAERGNFGAFIRVDNVADELYSDGSGINSSGGRFFNPADGRAVSGGVSLKF